MSFIKNKIMKYLIFDNSKRIYGAIFALIAFVLSCVFLRNIFFAFFYAGVFYIAGILKFRIEHQNRILMANILGAFSMLFVTYLVPFAIVSSVPFISSTPFKIFLNFVCIFLVCGIIYIFTASLRISVATGCGFLLLLATANGVLYSFRGKELGYNDLLSIKTAVTVADQYSLNFPKLMIHGVILWLLFMILFFAIPKYNLKNRIKSRFVALICEVAAFTLLTYSTSDIQIQTWNKHGTGINGYYLNFFIGIMNSKIEKPDGYDPYLPFMETYIKGAEVDDKPDEADKTAKPEKKPQDDIPEGDSVNVNSVPADSSDYPNIIVIMNESFSDPSVLGSEIRTNIPVTPFLDSLNENTIKGYALASIFGANTANSEFEFLTGHTMCTIPDNTVPYQQFINREIHTLPWYLDSLGYKNITTHPYYASGWSRNILYPLFGFSENYFIDSYEEAETIREYVSDKEVYDKILNRISGEMTSSPLFIFGITMQNHGGYTYGGDNFNKSVELVDYSKEYPLAEQYLSLLNESDKAIEYFLNELDKQEKETIVVFFGDHFPKIENEFYEEVYGGTIDDIEEQMLLYKVPFFIWANYDIEEKFVDCTSLNFLSLLLLKNAGIEFSPYYQFLSDFSNVVPYINALGFYSNSEGKFVEKSLANGNEKEWIDQNRQLQFNNLRDEQLNELVFGAYINKYGRSLTDQE